MTNYLEAHPERRAHQRWEYRVEVGLVGLRPKTGSTVDVSRGGVKVNLSEKVHEDIRGHTCMVHFLGAGDEIRPHCAVGTVRRLEMGDECSIIVIEFANPLEVLDLDKRA